MILACRLLANKLYISHIMAANVINPFDYQTEDVSLVLNLKLHFSDFVFVHEGENEAIFEFSFSISRLFTYANYFPISRT